MWQSLVCASLLLAAGGATATGSADFAIATVAVDNGIEQCGFDLALCLVDVQSEGDPGEWSVEAYQEFRSISVATNFSRVESLTFPLLPDESLVLHASDIYFAHPLLDVLSLSPYELDGFRVGDERFNISFNATKGTLILNWHGPTSRDPTAPFESHRQEYGLGEGTVSTTQIGPANTWGGGNSDDATWNVATLPCTRNYIGACYEALGSAANDSHELTPSAVWGLDIYDVEVATDPLLLERSSAWNRSAIALGVNRYVEASEPVRLEPTGAAFSPHLSYTIHNFSLSERLPPGSGPGGPQPASSLSRVHPAPIRAAPVLVLAAVASCFFLLVVAAALYAKLVSKERVLRSDLRQRIMGEVYAQPGLSPAQLGALIGLHRTGVDHHIAILRRTGLVRIEKVSNRILIYPPIRKASHEILVESTPVRARVYATLAGCPEGLTRSELHERLSDIPPRTRNHVLKFFVEQGVVRISGQPDPRFLVIRKGA